MCLLNVFRPLDNFPEFSQNSTVTYRCFVLKYVVLMSKNDSAYRFILNIIRKSTCEKGHCEVAVLIE